MMGIPKKTIDKIIALFRAGYTCSEIAETFNIPEGMIRSIVIR